MKTTFLNAKMLFPAFLAGLLCVFFTSPSARADEGDPPSRVARISVVEGNVSMQPGGEGDWGAAARNRPVTVGDKLWSDKDSRAELQAGEASIHMGSMTALSFLNLDENIMQVRMAEGAINFRVRELREGDTYEVDTPNLAFTVTQAGAFRIDVNENGDATRIQAIRGEGQVTAGGQTYPVRPGELAEFNGADNPQYQASQALPPDDLDRWAADRDLGEDNSTSAKYVNRDVPGYEDLDNNGEWSEQPDYGPVWYPNSVPVGWAPYSWGYWNWVGPWGWTWIGYEPWGFAPYHYGRWAFFGNRWGWCPGPIFARPFYGPAFVGFLGGRHFGVGFGFGAGFGVGVGWFPLGFHEPFFPGFHASRTYITNINVHNTVIRNANVFNAGGGHNFNYAYAHNVHAVTAMSRNGFTSGQAVNRGAARLTEASLRDATVSNHAAFTPTRESALGAHNMSGHIATPSASVANRAVMARTAPAAAASHSAIRPVTSASGFANRGNTGFSTARQNQLSQSRPSYNGAATQNRSTVNGGALNNRSTASAATNGRTWEAQGNSTDRGRAPEGFGSSSRSNNGAVNNPAQTARAAGRSDRPPWAGSGPSAEGGRSNSSTYNNNNGHASNDTRRAYEPYSNGSRGSTYNNGGQPSSNNGRASNDTRRAYEPYSNGSRGSTYNNGRQPSYNNGGASNDTRRSYEPYSAPSRTYSAPSAPSRTYSAPRSSYPSTRSYSPPPSHTSSAPSHSSGGGGSSHGGGGSPHGGGGGGSHGHR